MRGGRDEGKRGREERKGRVHHTNLRGRRGGEIKSLTETRMKKKGENA